MQGRRYWIDQGAFERAEMLAGEPASDKKRFESGHVRVTSGDVGTEIKWHAQTPCVTSLFFVMDWLLNAKAPFVLRFYISGWFEEFYQTQAEVTQRIEAIIARGDRHFPVKTFIEQVETHKNNLAPLLVDSLQKIDEIDEHCVECVYNRNAGRFEVQRVGKKSLIAKVYGEIESSFPRQSIGSYSEAVSLGYKEVLESGKPRADHVLAALRFPNNNVYWVPYHRLILPGLGLPKSDSVKVISQFGKIDFKII